jgi:molybdopterin-guanine dinucleotide biosynthesis protein A
MLAVYDRAVLPAVVAAVDGGQREPMALYPKLKVHYVREDELVRYDPDLRSFRHVSTPEEYRQALDEFASIPQEAP